MSTPNPGHKEDSRKVVFAFDIGTTFSGACYTFIDPGISPETRAVKLFQNDRGDFKVPSVLCYDREGKFHGAGDPSQWDGLEELVKIKWWKLMLVKGELPAEAKRHMTTNLPKGKSVVHLFADFIRYLFDATVAQIKEAEPTGELLWENFGPKVELVLAHPNGWKGREQGVMRSAVVEAKIFSEEEARSRVSFVTEGEASFNYCVNYTKSGKSLEADHNVLVIDAGGGTIDISSYIVRAISPLKVAELHLPKCAYQGAEIVTARATDYAQAKLKGSTFDNESDLQAFTECFDKGTKRNFVGVSKPHYSIKFGTVRDNDSRCSVVKDGQLRLQREEVAGFFEPSISSIREYFKTIAGDLDPKNTFVYLVGGFAASPWLFQEIGRELTGFGLKLSRPDGQTDKAVAFGAISYYLDRFVDCRLVEYTYGAFACTTFDISDPEHRQRSAKKKLTPMGEFVLDVFVPILFKGTRVADTEEFSDTFAGTSIIPPRAVESRKLAVVRYKGKLEKPQWVDLEPENYEIACHVVVDTKKIPFFPFISPMGIQCFIQSYDVVYTYGQTEFKAQIRWGEWGEEERAHRGDAVILYDNAVE